MEGKKSLRAPISDFFAEIINLTLNKDNKMRYSWLEMSVIFEFYFEMIFLIKKYIYYRNYTIPHLHNEYLITFELHTIQQGIKSSCP